MPNKEVTSSTEQGKTQTKESSEESNTPPEGSTETTEQTPSAIKSAAEIEADRRQRYYDQLEETVRDQGRHISVMTKQLEQQTQVQSPPAPAFEIPDDPEERRTKYFEDPFGTTQGIVESTVKQQMDEALKPLINFVQGFQTNTRLDQTFNRYKDHPKWGPYLEDPAISGAVKQVMAKVPADENYDNNFLAAVVNSIGLKQAGLIGDAQPTPVTSNQPTPSNGDNAVTSPPHLRPTGSPTPRGSENQPKRRDLTEAEARLARERNMSKDQFLDWIELPPDQVVHSTIGKEEVK